MQARLREAVQEQDAARHTLQALEAEVNVQHAAYVTELKDLGNAVDEATSLAEQVAGNET